MGNGHDQTTDSGLLVCTFHIGDALFGLDANQVQEVILPKNITVVHRAPPYIKGVINLRGRVVTIIDLGEKLSRAAVAADAENRIIIVDCRQEYVGLLVDRVNDVLQVERGALKARPENVHGIQADLVTSVFQNNEQYLIGLLDIERVLNVEEAYQP